MGLNISDINRRQRIPESKAFVFCNISKMPVFTESGSVVKENAFYILEHWEQIGRAHV